VVRLLKMFRFLYRMVGDECCFSFCCYGWDQWSFWPLGDVLVIIVSLYSHLICSAKGFCFLFVIKCVCVGSFRCRALRCFSCVCRLRGLRENFQILKWSSKGGLISSVSCLLGRRWLPCRGVECLLLLRVVSCVVEDRGELGLEAFYVRCIFCCFCCSYFFLLTEDANILLALIS